MLQKKKFIKFHYKNCDLKPSSRPFCVCKELSQRSIGKWNFSSTLLISDTSEQNYQNVCESAHRPLQIPFQKWFFETYEMPKTSLKATPFLELFDKKIYFVILHKLATFHYQAVFTSQVIQQNVFRVPCLGIWWRYDIWISKMLN